jgi:hypothetical protein
MGKRSKKDGHYKDELRVGTTIPIWGILLAMNIFLSLRVEGGEIIPIVFITLVAGVLATGFIWDWGSGGQNSATDKMLQDMIEGESEQEKRKRDRLSQALSQLSDSQLHALREGIRTGDIDDERLRYMLGEDGELVEYK